MTIWESDYRAVNGRTAFIVIVRTVNIPGRSQEDNRYLTRLKLWSKYQHACEASNAARMAYENHHPEVVANEIYARTMYPLPRAAERSEGNVENEPL